MTGPRLHRPIRDAASPESCGPTALSALTGLPAARFKPPGRKRGMSTMALQRFLNQHGFQTRVAHLRSTPRNLSRVLPLSGIGVAVTRDHFLAFEGWMVADTMRPIPVWVHDHPWRQKRVIHLVLILSEKEGGR